MKDRAHDEAVAEIFREDPEYAIQLLNSILEDGDQGELLVTLRLAVQSIPSHQHA